MRITPLKTAPVRAGSVLLTDVINDSVDELPERSVLIITSKIVSLCENSVRPLSSIEKRKLVAEEADKYLPQDLSKYGYSLTIKNNTLVAAAGIDESNSEDNYVLWPKDAQASANQLRKHLVEKYRLKEVGVIITDSVSQPLRRGTVGTALAYSGFEALRSYVGQPDIFGREFKASVANAAEGLAAAAVTVMGEGAEQTPLCIISELPFITFLDRDPSPEELAAVYLAMEDDIFAPLLQNPDWHEGGKKAD